MKKIFLPLWLASMAFGVAHAGVLATESFDYGIGSSATTWTGGTGFANRWQISANTTATIVDGLTFGSMPTSGGALRVGMTSTGSAFQAGNVFRPTAFGAVNSGDLWISYLYGFDVGANVNINSVSLQLRMATVLRTGVEETTSKFYVQYNTVNTKGVSLENGVFKDGTTLLMVFAFYDMGNSAGSTAKGWALTAADYAGVLAAGVTEQNLDDLALVSVIASNAATTSLNNGANMEIVPMVRGEGTVASFYVDEIRMGTSLTDVFIPEPQAAVLLLPLGMLAWVWRRRRG